MIIKVDHGNITDIVEIVGKIADASVQQAAAISTVLQLVQI